MDALERSRRMYPKCEACGMRKPGVQFSGVTGRDLCPSCRTKQKAKEDSGLYGREVSGNWQITVPPESLVETGKGG